MKTKAEIEARRNNLLALIRIHQADVATLNWVLEGIPEDSLPDKDGDLGV